MPLKVLRFVNLLLGSVFVGNAVGGSVFIHPALRTISTEAQVAAQRAITRRYASIMRALMPGFVISCLAMLGLARDRTSASYRFTLVGTIGFVAMLGVTAVELPYNKRTLEASPDAPPADWHELRAHWDSYNALRTACVVVGWCGLSLGALAATQEGR